MQAPRSRPLIDILVVAEASAGVVYGMHDLFMSAGRDWEAIVHGTPGPGLMQPRVVAARAGAQAVANGITVTPDATLDQGPIPQVVCVPELLVAPEAPAAGHFRDEVAWIRRCHDEGAIIATACSGAVLLAEAGLLHGQEATTHWAYCDVLRGYEDITVREQQALVISGEGQRLVMAGGGSSWLDLALYLTARLVGVDEAMRVARVNLIDWHDIGQQPFARLARSRQVEDAVIARCQVWIAENYQEASPVAAMVELSGLKERSFKRRFHKATGMSPLAYVHTIRLEEAKQMLEAGDLPVEAIANEVGYEDAGFFSRLFRRNVKLTPNQYRRRFGSLRRALQGGA